MNKDQRKKEFVDNRVSWKFFQKKIIFGDTLELGSHSAFMVLLLVEILKEVQFINDNKKCICEVDTCVCDEST